MRKTQFHVVTGAIRTWQESEKEFSPPAALSRPFTPHEFLAWLKWNISNGDVSLEDVYQEALSMIERLADVSSTLAH